ncbi:hypothetical protein V8E53_009800 [Lactarius tabidus]
MISKIVTRVIRGSQNLVRSRGPCGPHQLNEPRSPEVLRHDICRMCLCNNRRVFPRRKWTSSRRQGFFEGSHGSQRAHVADIRLNCSLTQTGSWHIPRCGQSVSPEFHVLTNVNIFLIDGSQIRLKMTARTCNIEQTSGHVRHNFVAGIMWWTWTARSIGLQSITDRSYPILRCRVGSPASCGLAVDAEVSASVKRLAHWNRFLVA